MDNEDEVPKEDKPEEEEQKDPPPVPPLEPSNVKVVHPLQHEEEYSPVYINPADEFRIMVSENLGPDYGLTVRPGRGRARSARYGQTPPGLGVGASGYTRPVGLNPAAVEFKSRIMSATACGTNASATVGDPAPLTQQDERSTALYGKTKGSLHAKNSYPTPGYLSGCRSHEEGGGDYVNSIGGGWFGGNAHPPTSPVVWIDRKLTEMQHFQDRCIREFRNFNEKMDTMVSQLEDFKEQQNEWRRSFDEKFQDLLNRHNAFFNRHLPTEQNRVDCPEFGSGSGGGGGAAGPGVGSGDPSTLGTESSSDNNLTLNNTVLPGSRANNFYDNFRSHTQLNLLTTPKNVIGISNGGNGSNTSSMISNNTESRSLDTINPSSLNRPRTQTGRNAFPTSTEFVENIGTKLLNQENDNHSRATAAPVRHNMYLGLVPAGPNTEQRRPGPYSLLIESDLVGALTRERAARSAFFMKNYAHTEFVRSLFELLALVNTDAERNKVLSCLSATILPPNSGSNTTSVLSSTGREPILSGTRDEPVGSKMSVTVELDSPPGALLARLRSRIRNRGAFGSTINPPGEVVEKREDLGLTSARGTVGVESGTEEAGGSRLGKGRDGDRVQQVVPPRFSGIVWPPILRSTVDGCANYNNAGGDAGYSAAMVTCESVPEQSGVIVTAEQAPGTEDVTNTVVVDEEPVEMESDSNDDNV